MQRGALVVVTCAGRHAVVDQQLHIAGITVHTSLEQSSYSIAFPDLRLVPLYLPNYTMCNSRQLSMM